MSEYISRDAAMRAACEALCYPGPRCPDFYCIEVRNAFNKIPAADVREVVYCKDCRYLPTGHSGFDLEWPDEEDYKCPFHCTDGWYSEMPKPDFFCANGERKEETE